MLSKVILIALVGSTVGFLETIFNREVCYNELGCFNTQTVRSGSRPVVLLPDTPAKIGTKFFLYTRQTSSKSSEEELNRKDVSSLTGSHFESRPAKIIIHGFTHDAHQPWVQTMKDELLKNADMNVIAVDWRNGAGFPYTQATANIRVVAAELTLLVKLLLQNSAGMSAGDIHIIGHSLGAHCAGEVGTKIKGLGRISGLDPAELYFEGGKEVTRLEPRDADFVDIIHSDGSAFLGSLGLGYRASTGHVDFYPNGGGTQPGCANSIVSKVTSSALDGIAKGTDAMKKSFACSHERSFHYFTESINSPCPFTGYSCKSYDDFKAAKCLNCVGGRCSRMGYHAIDSSARGDFYLMTNQNGIAPQCSYHYKVMVQAGMNKDKGYGTFGVTLMGDKGQTFGPVRMTEDDVDIASGTALSRIFVSPVQLGTIKSVKVTYDKGSCLTCFLTTDFVRLQRVEIYEGELAKSTTYCGKDVSLAKDQFRVVDAAPPTGC